MKIMKLKFKFQANLSLNQVDSSKRLLQNIDRLLSTLEVANPTRQRLDNTSKLMSFKIYLGDLNELVTADRIRDLFKCDLIILELLQIYSVDFITHLLGTTIVPQSIVGRLDLMALPRISELDLCRDISKFTVFKTVLETIGCQFAGAASGHLPLTGILLANFQDVFAPAELIRLTGEIARQGLHVYLEVGPKSFLNHPHVIKQESVSGLIIRNGLVMPNGQRRDYFDSVGLQPTLDACMAEKSLRNFTVMMWEPLNPDASATNPVMRRSSMWCQFHSALLWIDHRSCVFDPSPQSNQFEPLSAFDWLKRDDFMILHQRWKTCLPVGSSSHNLPQLADTEFRYQGMYCLKKLGIC